MAVGELRDPRHQVEDAADGVAAVEHRGRAADHLDPFDGVEVDEPRDLAEVGLPARVVEPQPVLEEEHPQTPLPADDRPRLVGSDAVDVDPGLVAQQVRGVVGRLALDLVATDDGHRRGDLEGIGLGAGGGDGHRGEEGAIFRRLGLSSLVGLVGVFRGAARLGVGGHGSVTRSPAGDRLVRGGRSLRALGLDGGRGKEEKDPRGEEHRRDGPR